MIHHKHGSIKSAHLVPNSLVEVWINGHKKSNEFAYIHPPLHKTLELSIGKIKCSKLVEIPII
jgi:hypothetical protein